MTVAGLIFSNIHDQCLPEMTRIRTIASIPFGGRYRLIDFALSNMVNSDITTVGVVTHTNYQSLLDHIGTGKDWDLARRSGGIKILPPYVAAYENNASGKLYENRLGSLMSAMNFINRCGGDYIVLSESNTIINIDLKPVIASHIEKNAYMTLVTKEAGLSDGLFAPDSEILSADENGKVTELSYGLPKRGKANVNANIIIMSKVDLQSMVADSISHGYKSFANDIIRKQLKKKDIYIYKHEGFCANISSMESYFKLTMKLLEDDVREDLFYNPYRGILTKVRNSAPTKYSSDAKVVNSMIADGCVIEGEVENSVIFRGVHIGKGTVVKNSIILQDTYIGEHANLNCVVTDKNVLIKDGRNLSGYETLPFFIGKGSMV